MNNLEMLLKYFSEEPEALARKLSANQCDECCVGCKAHCQKTNHGDKGCIDTILEWLQEEAPGICQNAYMTRIEQERRQWTDVLDKIKAKIEKVYKAEDPIDHNWAMGLKHSLKIINGFMRGETE